MIIAPNTVSLGKYHKMYFYTLNQKTSSMSRGINHAQYQWKQFSYILYTVIAAVKQGALVCS